VVVLGIGAEVVEGEQVGVLEVEALGHAPQFDVQVVAPNELQGHFLAAVAERVVDFAEPALADAALNRVPIEDPRARAVEELHGLPPPPRRKRPSASGRPALPLRFPHPVIRSFAPTLYVILPNVRPTASTAKAKSSPVTRE